jgi:hypothetical protein
MWVGGNDGIADATFENWGLARAVAEILNAVLDGRLASAEQLAELDARRCPPIRARQESAVALAEG